MVAIAVGVTTYTFSSALDTTPTTVLLWADNTPIQWPDGTFVMSGA